MSTPNIVLILTDTQSQCMVGAYGDRAYRTPNLDSLAESGIRFNRAYTACPLCTPARGAMFTGVVPAVNGAWANEMALQRQYPLMGGWFRSLGYRAGYTGKWHLDGAGYHGGGNPDGGFEGDWWYDGKRYLDEIGRDRHAALVQARQAPDALRELGCTVDEIWGHRVANRAIDFLETVGGDPFLLVVSFDEPHGPFVVPPEFADAVDPDQLPERPNFNAPLTDKPAGHQKQAREFPCGPWPEYARERSAHWNCNSSVDFEIGRVVDAVRRTHGEDTYIVYTSDHGDMMGSHGLRSKGAMMYEETVNIPFLVAGPGVRGGQVCDALVSHLDLLPTFLEWIGADRSEHLQGTSLAPLVNGQASGVRDTVSVQYNRFGLHHPGVGDLVPIRCTMDSRYKLVVNLFDRDELYDLADDPYEMTNRIDDAGLADHRDRLHDAMLAEMDATADPFRGDMWHNRPWREGRKQSPYFGLPSGGPPAGLCHGEAERP